MDYSNSNRLKPSAAPERHIPTAPSSTDLRQHLEDTLLIEQIQLQADQLAEEVTTSAPAGFRATPEQQAAIEGIVQFCKQSGSGNFCSFNGPAGSGKSTTSRLIRDALLRAGFTVNLCAPTHKACAVLAEACGVEKSETSTFASLLGLREKKTKDEVDFVPMPGSKPRLDQADVWLADEASMMHPKLLGYIEKAADFWTRIVFIGDQAQLSPVKYGRVSPALRCTPHFALTKVMRHDGAVLDAATSIRQTTGNKFRVPFHHNVIGDQSSVFTYADKREWQQAIITKALEHHEKDDPDGFRVVAYRNAEVSKLNAAIRKAVYGRNAAPFITGERVITHSAVKSPLDLDEMVFGSSRELVIAKAVEGDLLHPACADAEPFKCWELTVTTDDGGLPQVIRTIDPIHEGRLQVALSDLRSEALKNKGLGQAAWADFWDLRDSFAELQPYWCITCHKAQGSQFRDVFINARDLDTAAGGAPERRRLWYTAVTRAQRAIHVVADKEIG